MFTLRPKSSLPIPTGRRSTELPARLRIDPARNALAGTITPPPDKSITHRAYFFAALNRAKTVIINPSLAEDPSSTLRLLDALGYVFEYHDDRIIRRGNRRSVHPHDLTLDCGNSGTTARFAAGFLTGEQGRFTLVGDESLMRRPMERVAGPLVRLGAAITTTNGGLPLTIDAAAPVGTAFHLLEAGSAQVHGALVMAALRSERGVVIRRTKPMRDHTLRMARAFGVDIPDAGGRSLDEIPATFIERDLDVTVPGDCSSAAFLVAAALLVPGSRVRIAGVGLNPTRTAFLAALRAMGADVEWSVERDDAEPIGWIEAVHGADLHGIELGDDAPAGIAVAEMIDELPLLALVASQAHGRTIVGNAAELRVKESDRIAATARALGALGITITEREDGFVVDGPQRIAGGAEVDHAGDHRLAMVAAVAALAAAEPVMIPEPDVVAVSYPTFWEHLGHLAGGAVHTTEEAR